MANKVQEIIFTGPAGRLEGKYLQNDDKNAPVALVLHPHPLHGGTMNNKVVYKTFYTLGQECNFSVMRFNFRGVGKSSGTFDHGNGELMDAASALDWLQDQHPEASEYWIIGFSFGSFIGMQLLMRRPELAGFIAISPPVHFYDFSFLSPCPTKGLIIHGTKDQIVPEEAVISLYEKLNKSKHSNVEYYAIAGANHFYSSHMPELGETIENYVKLNVGKTENDALKYGKKRKKITDEENI